MSHDFLEEICIYKVYVTRKKDSCSLQLLSDRAGMVI